MISRGLRNNNPLNIRKSTAKWQGEVAQINGVADAAFCQFVDIKHGYRAALKLLYSYQSNHGCNTIRKIINRWAPPIENSTKVYINRVVRYIKSNTAYLAITEDSHIDLTEEPTLAFALVCAMHLVENGTPPSPNNKLQLQEALRMLS